MKLIIIHVGQSTNGNSGAKNPWMALHQETHTWYGKRSVWSMPWALCGELLQTISRWVTSAAIFCGWETLALLSNSSTLRSYLCDILWWVLWSSPFHRILHCCFVLSFASWVDTALTMQFPIEMGTAIWRTIAMLSSQPFYVFAIRLSCHLVTSLTFSLLFGHWHTNFEGRARGKGGNSVTWSTSTAQVAAVCAHVATSHVDSISDRE